MSRNLLKYLTLFGLLNFAGAGIADTLPIELPPVIYAVPDVECNVYFDNIVLTTNAKNYVFDVDCEKGRNDEVRWRFTPAAKDVGVYDWKIKVFNNENKVVASGETKIVVVSPTAGEGRRASMLIIGDSLTDPGLYQQLLLKRSLKDGAFKLNLIGSHGGGGKPLTPDKAPSEGYGGWKWQTFCTQWTDNAALPYKAKSKFLNMKDGVPVLDFANYLNNYANGKAPDFITILLGGNDVFWSKDDNIDKNIEEIMKYADTFIAALQKDAPNARIGIALMLPPASSQDGFGNNYGCTQTRWQYKRNQFRMNELLLKKFADGAYKNISLIPTSVNMDCERSYPPMPEPVNAASSEKVLRQNNGLHPGLAGYQQIADSYYSWLKHQLSQ